MAMGQVVSDYHVATGNCMGIINFVLLVKGLIIKISDTMYCPSHNYLHRKTYFVSFPQLKTMALNDLS